MFVTVAQHGSIAAAAQSLCKTQSAISIALKRLQDELQLALFHRDQYRLSLTEAGQKILRHCEFLLKQQANIALVAQHMANEPETKIHLVYESICHTDSIFTAVAAAQKHYPLTEFFLSCAHNLGAIQQLIEGKGDMAISPWIDRFQELEDFETLPFSRFKIITAVLRSALLDPQSQPSVVTDLAHLPLLMPQTMLFQLDLERMLGFVSASQIRTNDLWAQKAMLMNGAGWGYIPRHLVEQELARGELLELKLELVSVDTYGETRLVKLAKHKLGPAAELMWQTLAGLAE